MIKQRRQRGDKAKARNPNTCAANGKADVQMHLAALTADTLRAAGQSAYTYACDGDAVRAIDIMEIARISLGNIVPLLRKVTRRG